MKAWISALIVLFAIACVTAPPPRQIVNAFQVEASYDGVWQALIETMSDLQLPIQNMEKDSGLITIDWLDFTGQGNEGYCDCGKLGLGIEQKRQGRFNVFVKRLPGLICEIKVNATFEHYYDYLQTLYKKDCVSTGRLEAMLFDSIKAKIY